MGAILVAHEKHGEYYFPASTDEELSKSALYLLTERWNQGYWYLEPDEYLSSKYSPTFEDLVPGFVNDAPLEERQAAIVAYEETIKAVPDEDAQKMMKRKLRDAQVNTRRKNEYSKWYNQVKELVESQDHTQVLTFKNGRTTPLSWSLLQDRSDAEYERVELEHLQEV
jgi:rubrerythrin